MARIVVWFSAGAASAVASKLTLEKYPKAIIAYCDTGSEHPDNARFIVDCEKWLGTSVIMLKSPRYKNIWDVFEKTRYLVGVAGARCSTELKKVVRREFQQPDDLQIFGFTIEERSRAKRFRLQNLEVELITPLIERGLKKADCLAVLRRAGIKLPAMYGLGYRNNNCIGCVKGQQGYWNKIRMDFPEVFQRMSIVERELNIAINKSYAGDGLRKRVFLDELDPDAGKYSAEDEIECGLFCTAVVS